MNIMGQLIILGVIAIVIILLIIALIKSIPRNDRFHKNITPRQNRLIRLVIIAALIAAVIFFIRRFKESGVGTLFTDAQSVNEVVSKITEEGNTVRIVIGTHGVKVQNREYADAAAASAAIAKAASDNKTFVITDDYASRREVEAVLGILKENGVTYAPEDVIIEDLSE